MRVLDLNIPSTSIHALSIISCSFLLYMKKESELLACFRDITSGGDIGLSLGLLIPLLSTLHCQLYFVSARFCQISCFASKTLVSFSFFKEERSWTLTFPTHNVDKYSEYSLLPSWGMIVSLWRGSWLALKNPLEVIIHLPISLKNLLYREDSLDKLLKAIRVPVFGSG